MGIVAIGINYFVGIDIVTYLWSFIKLFKLTHRIYIGTILSLFQWKIVRHYFMIYVIHSVALELLLFKQWYSRIYACNITIHMTPIFIDKH